MSEAKSNRIRKSKQQNKTTCNLNEIKKAIKKAQKNKQGLDEQFIHTYLNMCSYYFWIGYKRQYHQQ